MQLIAARYSKLKLTSNIPSLQDRATHYRKHSPVNNLRIHLRNNEIRGDLWVNFESFLSTSLDEIGSPNKVKRETILSKVKLNIFKNVVRMTNLMLK